MSKKRFTTEQRRQAVEDYISGPKTAQEVADELGTIPQTIYRWKS